MAHDEALLSAARIARDRLDELHDEAELGRATYYQAIKRLHAAGGSMREIADALGLSHQRVHQIVNGGVDVVLPARKPGLLERLVGRRSGAECSPGRAVSDALGDDLADRFFVDAREAMSLAAREAELRGDDCIGTEHLLLGLLATEHGLAARLLSSIGVDSRGLRKSVDHIVGRGPGPSRSRRRRLLPRAKKVLELARREAKSLRSPHVRSEHLLLAIAREGDGVGARLLHELGLGYEQLRRRVERAGVVCSFCGRSGFDVAHLVAGPGVFICEHCLEEASDSQDQAGARSGSFMRDVAAAASDLSCSFCGKRRADVERLVAARPPARICDECIELCREIRDDELG